MKELVTMKKHSTLQEVYKNSSDEVKEALKSKFSAEDLGIEINNNQIRDEVLNLIKSNIKNIRFINENGNHSNLPSLRFRICNEVGDWLFDINYEEGNKHFWYSYYRIWPIFESKYKVKCHQFNEIIKSLLEEHLNLKGVTPGNVFIPLRKLFEKTSDGF